MTFRTACAANYNTRKGTFTCQWCLRRHITKPADHEHVDLRFSWWWELYCALVRYDVKCIDRWIRAFRRLILPAPLEYIHEHSVNHIAPNFALKIDAIFSLEKLLRMYQIKHCYNTQDCREKNCILQHVHLQEKLTLAIQVCTLYCLKNLQHLKVGDGKVITQAYSSFLGRQMG